MKELEIEVWSYFKIHFHSYFFLLSKCDFRLIFLFSHFFYSFRIIFRWLWPKWISSDKTRCLRRRHRNIQCVDRIRRKVIKRIGASAYRWEAIHALKRYQENYFRFCISHILLLNVKRNVKWMFERIFTSNVKLKDSTELAGNVGVSRFHFDDSY